jgi:phosphatidylserine/phosphatidylglycerophosphate/cardiolipin synthase-like enzyme
MKVRVYHNGDDVFVAWKPKGVIVDCRGFALLRRRNGVEEVVSTWVGFENQPHTDGERRASTNWPIQKYQWTDYMAAPGDHLQYRVIPMVGPNKDSLRAADDLASDWTPSITLSNRLETGIEAHFNRGIVAAQWVSRRLGVGSSSVKNKKLRTVIETAGDPFREYLYGTLGTRLFELLAAAAKDKRHVYGALYELDDEQLETALLKLGKRAHVVLGNGSVKKKGEDQNAPARKRLKGKVDLHDRMTSPRALAHNKFLVICDGNQKPKWVWTGSQNWTKTGLCTQANNSVLIEDRTLAEGYRKQWDLLRVAKEATPATLKTSNTKVRKSSQSGVPVNLWFTPTVGQVDLAEARSLIKGAKQSILFMMFNPGPKDTLLNSIIDSARKGVVGRRLYIRGAINQDPSTTKTPVELFDSTNSVKSDYDTVLPAAIDEPTKWFRAELKKLNGTFAMVHSKVVLVDPTGPNPIVLTGSHNLGPKASGTNDENLLIIRNARRLAPAYATNIMAIYNQYRWRFRRQRQAKSKRWDGLVDRDDWQQGYLRPNSVALREIDFWVGL